MRRPTGGRNLSARHDLMPGSGMNSDVTPGEGAAARPVARTAAGSLFTRPDRRRVRAVADRRRRRPARAADRRPALHLGLGRGPGPARRQPDRLPALDADRAARRLAARRRAAEPRRLTAFNADVLAELELREPQERHVDGRRPRHPGLVHPGRRGRAAARRPRSTAARTRSTAGRRSGSSRSSPRTGSASSTATRAARRATAQDVQRRQPPRLGPGPDARRAGRRRRARRRRPGRPGPPGRDRRLVRRLPDQLDRRPRPAVPGRDDLPIASATWRCCS